MNELTDLRKSAVTTKYLTLHVQAAERWYRMHDRSDLPAPDWLDDVHIGPSPLDPETDGEALTNATVTAFLAGHAIRDSGVDCYRGTLVTTANYAAVKASLMNVGLDRLHRVLFTVDESVDPPLIRISGGDRSVVAPIMRWPGIMSDPWNGMWSFATDSDFF